jgi:hypothetical protein
VGILQRTREIRVRHGPIARIRLVARWGGDHCGDRLDPGGNGDRLVRQQVSSPNPVALETGVNRKS